MGRPSIARIRCAGSRLRPRAPCRLVPTSHSRSAMMTRRRKPSPPPLLPRSSSCSQVWAPTGGTRAGRIQNSARRSSTRCSSIAARANGLSARARPPSSPTLVRLAASRGSVRSRSPARSSIGFWCAPAPTCTGVPFWANVRDAGGRCATKVHVGHVDVVDWAAYGVCFTEDVERSCPALVGTDWETKVRAAIPHAPGRWAF